MTIFAVVAWTFLTVLWLVCVGALIYGHFQIEKEKREHPERFVKNRITGKLER